MKFPRVLCNLLALLGRGVLLGIGFTAGFLLVFAACWPVVSASTTARTDARLLAARVAVADVEVGDVVRRPREHGWAFFGSLTNRGSIVARRIDLETQLLRGGEVVGVCQSETEYMVAPGEKRYVAYYCGSERDPLVEHDDFRLVVVSTD